MKTQPLKGMRDLLPREQALRDYIQGQILATYRAAGFQRISTPILEDMENLDKSDGGDNLNLIFKVLKRGDKLTAALNSGDPKELSDMGLRYDLTLPLSRFYAANKDKLPHPFKVIQTDRVFRAERPQKGRLREFVQCDIDILGDASPNAEVELIDVTTRALLNIGFTGFTVNINDRRILRAMLEKMGFAADQLDSVCISFDKMDKIGADGVKAELTEKLGLKPDTLVIVCAGKLATKAVGVAIKTFGPACEGHMDKERYEFCWIVDFPMYEIGEESGELEFCHNPFSMPNGGLEILEKAERGEVDPLDIYAYQYDLVCNGVELSSGAVRNHDPEIMVKAFELVRLGEDDVKAKFPAMYNAFCYGAPPHAGIAPGVDRMVMLLAGEDCIREIIPFPMNKNAQDIMMGAPSEVTQKQLDELHIAVTAHEDE